MFAVYLGSCRIVTRNPAVLTSDDLGLVEHGSEGFCSNSVNMLG